MNGHGSGSSLRREFLLNQPTPITNRNASSYRDFLATIRPSDRQPHSPTLGVASRIFVLSLPRRVDRRKSMSSLSVALDLHFEYVDGVEASDDTVDRALDIVRHQRKTFRKGGTVFPGFTFDDDDNGKWNDTFDNWLNDTHSLVSPSLPVIGAPTTAFVKDTTIQTSPLPCASPEDPFPMLSRAEVNTLPPWRILSREMLACWVGHLRIIHRIAKSEDKDAVAIVLEDDVDMEFDIEKRLQRMWLALPHKGWDIVMLGYCHSDEMVYPPIPGAASIRPSFAPKCTHAYALSRAGARKLFRMLTMPGVLFSRAIDQALSWLIKGKKLRSFSVVPAVIIQRKLTRSDIWRPHVSTEEEGEVYRDSSLDRGSKWRGVLVDSTLERVEMATRVWKAPEDVGSELET